MKVECYCCHREVEEKEVRKVYSTTSRKCADGTEAELRFVCKKCHLKECINCGDSCNKASEHCPICFTIDEVIQEVRREKREKDKD